MTHEQLKSYYARNEEASWNVVHLTLTKQNLLKGMSMPDAVKAADDRSLEILLELGG